MAHLDWQLSISLLAPKVYALLATIYQLSLDHTLEDFHSKNPFLEYILSIRFAI